MKRPTLLLFPLLLFAVACAPPNSGTLGPGPSIPAPSSTPVATPAGSPAPAATESEGAPASGRTVTVQVWFQRAGKLFPTKRTRPATVTTSRLALTELAAGPSGLESSVGVGSNFATGTQFEIKGIAGGVETVSFPASFYGGPEPDLRLRQAQVVYTLTQFPSVSRVAFLSDGKATIGGPFGRADMAGLLPHIVVLSPAIGDVVTSPVTVSGTADVFEATVSMGIFDSSGKEIATKFATALCSIGCHGDYTMTVPIRPCDPRRPGTIQVYSSSPEDGSRLYVVNIPVTLSC